MRLLHRACNPFSAELLAHANAPGRIIALYSSGEQARSYGCRLGLGWLLCVKLAAKRKPGACALCSLPACRLERMHAGAAGP